MINKKKILLVNYGYYPAQKYGGPVNSVKNFCELMRDEYRCFVLSCDHEMNESERLPGITDGWNKYDENEVLYLSDKDISYSKIKSIILELKPDIIYIQSIFEAAFVIPILRFYKHNNSECSVIIAPRGDLCKGAMRKKYKKIPYLLLLKLSGLIDNVIFHSTADDESDEIRRYFGSNSIIYQIENIPSVIGTHEAFIEKNKNELHTIFVSRISPKKNLIQAIRIINSCSDGIYLDIYGPIEDKEYWNECCKIIEESCNDRIKYKGMLEHEMVYNELLNHDLFLFPTFSENYGHVIVESMQCGCPVMLSDQTPWNDINNAGVGYAFSLMNIDKFVSELNRLKLMDNNEYYKLRKKTEVYINDRLDFNTLKNSYRKMIENCLR